MPERLADAVWQPWLLGLFLLTGLWCSVRSGFFQFFGLRLWLGSVLGCLRRRRDAPADGSLTQAQALCTALASTIGTGSVAGVATALCLGGPGAIFWMWLSALLGLMTGFAEKTLAVLYRRRRADGSWEGGPAYWLDHVLHRPVYARWFSLWCVLSALAGGALVQAHSMADVLHATFGCAPAAVGALTAAAVALVGLGGLRAIGKTSERLAPAMALLFLGAGLLAILARAQQLPAALRLILDGALSPRALAGGSWLSAMRYGVARGVFTNEAGVGSSALAHAAADTDDPAAEGFLGMFEAAFATLVVCTVTALVILTSGVYDNSLPLTGAPLASAAFAAVLGPAGEGITAAAVLLFAFTSLLGWYWYGQQGLDRLTDSRRRGRLYRGAYLLAILAGSTGSVDGVWAVSDLCTAAMAVVTLPAILVLSPAVWTELNRRTHRSG